MKSEKRIKTDRNRKTARFVDETKESKEQQERNDKTKTSKIMETNPFHFAVRGQFR
jgi:hypothetical protein